MCFKEVVTIEACVNSTTLDLGLCEHWKFVSEHYAKHYKLSILKG